MGSEEFYPEERPVHPVSVDGFWIDAGPVTVEAFRRSSGDGYVTIAERPLDPEHIPTPIPRCSSPDRSCSADRRSRALDDTGSGGVTFRAPWKPPEGPGSTVDGRERHPSCRSPTRTRRRTRRGPRRRCRARRSGSSRHAAASKERFAWGDEHFPDGRPAANTWQGEFPGRTRSDGYLGTSPVGTFPANGYGLYDMAATRGSGRATGTRRATRRRLVALLRAAQPAHDLADESFDVGTRARTSRGA